MKLKGLYQKTDSKIWYYPMESTGVTLILRRRLIVWFFCVG